MKMVVVVPAVSAEMCATQHAARLRGGGQLAGSANQGLKAMRSRVRAGEWPKLRLGRGAVAASRNMRLRGMQRYDGMRLSNAESETNAVDSGVGALCSSPGCATMETSERAARGDLPERDARSLVTE
jgi:hypothetical protein